MTPGQVAALVEARVVVAEVGPALVAGRVHEILLRKLLRDLLGRIHVAEARREDDRVAALRELADHAFRVGALGDVLDVLRLHLVPKRRLHLLAPLVVLERPSGIADRAHVNEPDLDRRRGRLRAARPGPQSQQHRTRPCARDPPPCLALDHRYSPESSPASRRPKARPTREGRLVVPAAGAPTRRERVLAFPRLSSASRLCRARSRYAPSQDGTAVRATPAN